MATTVSDFVIQRVRDWGISRVFGFSGDRIEALFFDGTLDPSGGVLRPDPETPGNGLVLRESDAEPFRVA